MKIIGCFLIIIASIASSYFYENSLKSNIKILEELIIFIKTVKSKIEYYSLSIDEIFSDYTCKNSFLKQLLNGEFTTIIHLNENIQKDIKNFFSSLGKGYKKEQLSLCDYTINSLESTLNNLKSEFIKKAKIFRSLSLFLGVGIVILLV